MRHSEFRPRKNKTNILMFSTFKSLMFTIFAIQFGTNNGTHTKKTLQFFKAYSQILKDNIIFIQASDLFSLEDQTAIQPVM